MSLARRHFLSAFLVLACLSPAQTARASTILDTGVVTFATTGTQLGRLNRNGVASDWGQVKPFPGIVNSFLMNAFDLFTVNVGSNSFIR